MAPTQLLRGLEPNSNAPFSCHPLPRRRTSWPATFRHLLLLKGSESTEGANPDRQISRCLSIVRTATWPTATRVRTGSRHVLPDPYPSLLLSRMIAHQKDRLFDARGPVPKKYPAVQSMARGGGGHNLPLCWSTTREPSRPTTCSTI